MNGPSLTPEELGELGKRALPRRPPGRRETEIQHAILEALRAIGCLAWRQNVGALQLEGRTVFFGVRGMSDILSVIPPSGRLLAVEVKSDRGQLTLEQQAFLATVGAAGGVALVARSVDDVIPVVLRLMGRSTP